MSFYTTVTDNDKPSKVIGLIKNDNHKVVDQVIRLSENKNGKREIFVIDSKNQNGRSSIISIPSLDKRESIFVCGKNGSGKSYFVAERAVWYKLIHPNNEIYLFSMADEDPAYAELEKRNQLNRVDVEEFLEADLNIMHEFKDCLCIFDDVDAYANTKVQKAIYNVMSQILKNCRKNNVSIYHCSHHMNGTGVAGEYSRTVFLEMDAVVIFNQKCPKHQVRYVLKKYFDYDKKTIDEIIKQDTRWTFISKDSPEYYLTQYYAKIIDL